jgi:hypothetical protein
MKITRRRNTVANSCLRRERFAGVSSRHPAFSGEADTGSRKEKRVKTKNWSPVLIRSEPEML